MMKRSYLFTGALAALIGLTVGCEWTGTSSEESWNDAYSWANFSGTYRLYNTDTGTEGTEGTTETVDEEVQVTGENQGVTVASDSYSGVLARKPVVAGSLTLTIAGVPFVDNGSEVLVGGQRGTIKYGTGAWTARTDGDTDANKPISATYRYMVQGTIVTPGTPGTPGSAISTFTVNQQGNLLTFTDNNGMVYSGRVTGANVPSDSRVSANVRLTFEVASSSAKIVGTLSGDWSGGETGTLANRSMLGTYSAQGGIDVDIQAASGSIAITPKPVTSN